MSTDLAPGPASDPSPDFTHRATPDDHARAMVEIAFLVDAFASTIDNVMGGATGPVGRIAGRDMAKKLPLHLGDPSLMQTLAALSDRMKAGFDVTVTSTDVPSATDVQSATDVPSTQSADPARTVHCTIGTCFVRDLCARSGRPTGGAACKLFHAYLDGIVNELMRRPVKSEVLSVGTSCTMKMVTQ